MLDHSSGTRFSSAEYKKMSDSTEGSNNQQNTTIMEEIKNDDPPFKLPPITAIAGVLIRDWAEGKIGFPPEDGGAKHKGHL